MKKAARDTFGRIKHIPCFCHTVNLIAEQAIEKTSNLNSLIEKVRNLVKYVKNSTLISDELRRQQQNEGWYRVLCGLPENIMGSQFL